ncbi:MAG: hypothetical protein IKC31_02490 [Clostridia bacterium]|nr:hypothetical protein [Clostridia bacterium]
MKNLKRVGNIFFWITLGTPILSFALASRIGESEIFGVAGIVRYSWIMWLFIPIGIVSILIGMKLKNSNQKYKKNFIVAFICLPLIIIFGSYRFIFSTISYDTNKVIQIEEEIKIELPHSIKIATIEFDSYYVSYLKIVDKDSKITFENELEKNDLWQKKLSYEIKGLLPPDIQCEIEPFEHFIFYDTRNQKYNSLPSTQEHNFIFIAYDDETQRLVILDTVKAS